MIERRLFATLWVGASRTNFYTASELMNAITRLMQRQMDFTVHYPE